jgi:hypothetical protein
MSKLKCGGDDHVEAVERHVADAQTLFDAGRYHGSAYLNGYVVECALKAVVLHDRSFDAATRTHNPAELAQWHKTLRHKYGHCLNDLASITLGPEGARYSVKLPSNAAITGWRETLRYAGHGSISETQAREYQTSAQTAHCQSVLKMRLDGVI